MAKLPFAESLRRREAEDRKRGYCLEDSLGDLFLSYSQVATILGIPPARVQKLCERRLLGYIVKSWRHGHYKRQVRVIPRSCLAEYLKAQLATLRLPVALHARLARHAHEAPSTHSPVTTTP